MKFDHHLKAYIFFLILSISLVGILVFLYLPRSSDLESRVLDPEDVMSEEIVSISAEVSSEATSARRIRLTRMLLRYQSDLQKLESREGIVAGTTESELHTSIELLRNKIEKLQSMITHMTQ